MALIYKNYFRLLGLLLLLFIASCSSKKAILDSASSTGKTQIELDIEFLSSDKLEGRASGTKSEKLAAEYIANRFKALGIGAKGTKAYYQDFSVKNESNPHGAEFTADGSGLIVRNVIGYIDNKAKNTVVIGAHYDHLGYGDFGSLHAGDKEIHNGADDNASGVAGLLYLADKLRSSYKSNNYLFIAFSGEEHGLWGSNYFTKNPTIPLTAMNYMINMDMIGRMKAENKLSINGVGTSPVWNPALDKINKGNISLVTTESGVGSSDHTSFYLSQVPAIHFFTGQHEDYHKPSDDEDKINYSGLQSTVKIIMALISELDNKGKLDFIETKSADEQSRVSFSVTLGVIPDYLYDGAGMRIDGVRADKPAANAGIEKGDIVLKMGDLDVADMQGYMKALSSFKAGDVISVVVKRGDQLIEKEVKF